MPLSAARLRLLLSLIGVIAVAALFFGIMRPATPADRTISLSDLAQRITAHEITEIRVSDTGGVARTTSGQVLSFTNGRTGALSTQLADLGVNSNDLSSVSYVVADAATDWFGLLLAVAPVLLFAGLMIYMWRRMRGGGGNPMQSFGRSPARSIEADRPTIMFTDVAGVEEPKQELQEVVEFLKEPSKFAALGARIPRGVLLVGPPGTGKTLLARAVAGEGGVPFFNISGSEFVEMFVGVGASRVRDLFDKAKKSAPCIVFIDEIDAVGRQRGAGLGNANDEREQTLNQILVEMDGFDDHAGVIVIAATNRPDVLDPALLRPGRFDRVVMVLAPDVRGRRAILDVHARGKPFEESVAFDTLAKQTPGFSGADLANVLNEGAILAARHDKKTIGMAEIEEAIDRVSVGPERKSRVMSDQEKELTAYHESGHAVVARYLVHHDPVHKITIIPRGLRVGHTRFLAPEDRMYMTRSQFQDIVTEALGGHAAESVVFGEMSTGASDDIQRATSIARKMIKQWGMSERLGPVALGRNQQAVFLGRGLGEQKDYSDRVSELIDDEIRRLIDEAYSRAASILRQHRDVLDRLARELVGRESLDAPALELIFQGA